MLGVTTDARDAGLGLRLKLAQRERSLAMGIDLVEWTYDPLQALNAHLNFTKLGRRGRGIRGEHLRRVEQPAAQRIADRSFRRGVEADRAARRAADRAPAASASCATRRSRRRRWSIRRSRPARWLAPGPADLVARRAPPAGRDPGRLSPSMQLAESVAGARVAHGDARDLSALLRARLSGRRFFPVAGRRDGATICWRVVTDERELGLR